MRQRTIIHAKYKGNVGSWLAHKIAKKEFGFVSVAEMYRF